MVALTAPVAVSLNSFLKWQRDGVDAGTSTSVTVTMDANHTLTAVYGPEPLAPRNVPEATGYTLVYSLAVPNQANFNTGPVPYEVDNHASVGGFTRIAYYVELQLSSGALQYVWVSMDPFTSDITKIGVPTQSSGAVFQQLVAKMNVRSSVASIVNGDAIETGNIEFWPTCYSASNGQHPWRQRHRL